MPDATMKDRIEELFLQAQDLNGAARTRFLDEQCAGSPDIRAEVERLLQANDKADSLLDRPAAHLDSTSASEAESMEGTTVGPFKLLQQIGEGGFGVVYMAEQTQPVRRKVALKIVKPGMDSKEVVARFEAERQALAMMDHPNIAKVLDAGTTESGRPYFAMELVKGVSITDYCDENNLPTKERLKLFQQVCRAVQHAHQKGIIHRDLKPSNVMVTLHDGEPVPKVIDFGVAKALSQHLTEKTLFTRYGQIVGTPQYMSPEQAEMSGLDVDTRSDIYSLGVLLYELLTGQTPLDASTLRSAGYDAMRKMIRESEPPRPSTKYRTLDKESATCIASQRATIPATLSKTIAGDLDWIVMKTLEKNRNRRYDSANGLLGDIDRYLNNDPVEAGPPTFGYLFSKLYQRNKAAVLSTAAIVCLLLAATGISTWAWLDATAQRGIAIAAVEDLEEKQGELETQKSEAELQAAKAKTEAKRSQATLDVLKSLITQATPDPKLGTEVKVSDFLGTFAEQLQTASLEDPNVEIEVRTTLAKSFQSFSEFEEATAQLDVVEKLGRTLYANDDIELAKFLVDTTRTRRENREALLLEAWDLLKTHEGETMLKVEVWTVLAWLAGRTPELSAERNRKAIEFAELLDDSQRFQLNVLPERRLAEALNDQDLRTEALEAAESAVALAKRLENDRELALSLSVLSSIQWNLLDREAAFKSSDEAVHVANNAGAIGTELFAWRNRLRLEQDRTIYNRELQLKLAKQAMQFVEQNWDFVHRESGDALASVLGTCRAFLWTAGARDDAARLAEKCKLLAPALQSSVIYNVAQHLRWHGDIERSIEFYDLHNQTIPEGLAASGYWGMIACGRAYESVRDFESQLAELQKAVEVGNDGVPPWTSISLDFSIASTLQRLGRIDEAQRLFSDLTEEMPKHSLRLWGEATASAYLYWVEMSGRQDELAVDSADSFYGQALRQLNDDMPVWPTGRVYTHAALGMIAERKGDLETAIDRFVKANNERPGAFAQVHTEWITDHMVELLVNAERLDECEKILREDIKRRDKQVTPIHPERAFVRVRLVQFLVDHERDTTGVKEWLAVAKDIYDHHSNVLPQAERDKLTALERAVERVER